MTIQETLEKAKEIEKTTDATIAGAIVQVCKELDIDDCKSILMERAGGDEKKIKRANKKLQRAQEDDYFFNSLRCDIENILISYNAKL